MANPTMHIPPSFSGAAWRLRPLARFGLLGLGLGLAAVLFEPAVWRTDFASGLLSHGHCYLWRPGLVWLHVVSDSLIGLSYLVISITLTYLVYRARQDVPFGWMLLAFGFFIVACGGTHLMEVWTVWNPLYWLAGNVKALTAAASVATAVVLPPVVPKVLALIHEAKLSEERRRQVQQANAELRALNEKLTEYNRLKTEFFANVSHELRTPLTLVLGPTEKLLRSGGLTEPQRQDLQVVERNARILHKQVNDLLDVSKLDAGKMKLAYVETDLARLIRATADDFMVLARERQVAFSVETPPTVMAQVDIEKVQRVLVNLLSNAFKFTPAGGSVIGLLRTGGDEAVLEVQDGGPGVPPHLREAIFERFRQGEGGPTRTFGGTGLGLAIVKEFIELHGGSVSVGDAPDGGALFTVRLPLMAPPGAAVRRAADRPDEADALLRAAVEELRLRAEAAPAVSGADRPLVLVVEDNRDMNRLLVEWLAPDYRTVSAFDGLEGLEKALELRPDLILSDVMMPKMSGGELMRAVRVSPELCDVPIIILTARADDELRVGLLRERAQDYLTKPILMEELRARVGNLVAVKRARDLMQRELSSQEQNVAALANEIVLGKRQIERSLQALKESEKQLAEALREKEVLLKEVHHRVKNNLQIISSLLKLQAASIQDRQVLDLFRESQRRVKAIALLHDMLCGGREGQVDMALYIRQLARHLREAYGIGADGPRIGIEVDQVSFNMDMAMRCGLIIGELLSNSLRHAFPDGRSGTVTVALAVEAGGRLRISVGDDGVGSSQPLDPAQSQTLGLQLVSMLVRDLEGTVEMRSARGTTITILRPFSKGEGAGHAQETNPHR
ncbi:MAG: ATP-binding protein [Nitrospirota bacterium]